MIEPEGYLYMTVELIETYADIPQGSFGYCTADLQDYDGEDIFAVKFHDIGWITFKDKGVRDKFKIII